VIVFAPIILSQEKLDAVPRGFDGVRVVPGVRIDKVDAMVDGAVLETLNVEIAVRTPAITIVEPGLIQAYIMAVNVSAVLSGTRKRNVLPDPRSTPPNTH
jgi:hypothetical protein